MNERPTPETNAMRGEWAEGRFWPYQGGPLVQVEDAERLERERDEAREELEDWRNAAKGAENPCPDEKHCTCVPLLHKMLKDARETVARLNEWHYLTDAGLRLRLGEMTAQEIRTVRAVLNAVLMK